MKKENVSTVELSRLSSVSLDQIYKLIYCGRIPAQRIAGRWKIARTDAERFIRERKARLGARNEKP